MQLQYELTEEGRGLLGGEFNSKGSEAPEHEFYYIDMPEVVLEDGTRRPAIRMLLEQLGKLKVRPEIDLYARIFPEISDRVTNEVK